MAPLPQPLQEQSCLEAGEALAIAAFLPPPGGALPRASGGGVGARPRPGGDHPAEPPPSTARFPGSRRAAPPTRQSVVVLPGADHLSRSGLGPAVRLDVDHFPGQPGYPPGRSALCQPTPPWPWHRSLPHISALVVETGEPHSHLAFLVRERRLPAIFALGADTSRVPEGTVVSVDAGSLMVSAGPILGPGPDRVGCRGKPAGGGNLARGAPLPRACLPLT